MTIRVAINGYGRIGRNIFRALYESKQKESRHRAIEIVAINDLGNIDSMAHLTQYDSVHGKFFQDVNIEDKHLIVGEDSIYLLSEAVPEKLPWQAMSIDVVYECTGRFTTREDASSHLTAGAKKVIISAPGADVDATIVYGVNHQSLDGHQKIISNASCTTNCLAPVVKVLHQAIGVERGNMTTIHAYTNDQFLTDENCPDLFRARAATQSLIPTKTGAASAVGLVLPELDGKLNGMAVRVPTINVSLIDLHFIARRETSVEEVHQLLEHAATEELDGILEINTLPLVSIDYNHNAASSIVDFNHTQVDGKLVKVMAWYDNEWGFSNRMLDTTLALMGER